MTFRRTAAIAVVFLVGLGSPAGAQDEPIADPGVTAIVPLVDDIVIDGELSDWAEIPSVTTSSGPQLSADPENTGQFTWQVAGVGQSLAFAATVVDATIVAGQHGQNYWNEDSVELYVNFSGDETATEYGPGIGQLTFSPIDVGNTDPTGLTITGANASDFVVNGFVFATPDGWGLEVSIDLAELITPAPLDRFGLQVHANGSSDGDRDTKLIWSLADVDDTSFTDPSVFGAGVFVRDWPASAGATDGAGVGAGADVTGTAGSNDDAVGAIDDQTADVVTDESAAVADNEVETASRGEEPESGRFFLLTAVFTAATLMAGGLLIERKRQADEKRSVAKPD